MTYEKFIKYWAKYFIQFKNIPYRLNKNGDGVEPKFSNVFPRSFYDKIQNISITCQELVYDIIEDSSETYTYAIQWLGNNKINMGDRAYNIDNPDVAEYLIKYCRENFQTGHNIFMHKITFSNIEEFKKCYEEVKKIIRIIEMQDTFEETGLSQMGILS